MDGRILHDRRRAARAVAVGASLTAAALYFGVGLRLVGIGPAAGAGTTDLFAFGVTMALLSMGAAGLIAATRVRFVQIAVAGFEVLAIIGYVALSDVREPPFELWGVLTTACHLVVLASVVYLIARGPAIPRAPGWGHAH